MKLIIKNNNYKLFIKYKKFINLIKKIYKDFINK